MLENMIQAQSTLDDVLFILDKHRHHISASLMNIVVNRLNEVKVLIEGGKDD